MRYTLSADNSRAVVNSAGAELTSLCLNDSREIIWPGGYIPDEPDRWTGSAPHLFPFVGRLRGGTYSHRQKIYSMPKHGFARKSDFTVTEQCRDSLTCTLTDSPKIFQIYPFQFVFSVCFTLSENALSIRCTIKNSGNETLFFFIGFHPGFLLSGENAANDYAPQGVISFSKEENLTCSRIENELLSAHTSDFPLDQGMFSITDALFKNDALIFKNIKSDTITLTCPDQLSIHINTGGAPHLGIWKRPKQQFVCIEPWYSTDESPETKAELAQKPGILSLPPGGQKEYTYAISK